MATRSTPATASTAPSYVGPFITVAILFFIFGFITNLNMALVPHLRSIFDLPYAGHARRVGLLPGILCLRLAHL